jgi:hypothetical protein
MAVAESYGSRYRGWNVKHFYSFISAGRRQTQLQTYTKTYTKHLTVTYEKRIQVQIFYWSDPRHAVDQFCAKNQFLSLDIGLEL